MNSLPRKSAKRLKMEAEGTYPVKIRKPIKRTVLKPAQGRKLLARKPKKTSLRLAKKKAWDQFSKFIRLRDADEFGMVQCCTCPARKHWKEMDAGHYITRAKASVLLDEGNVHGQCSGCNRFQGGKFFEHMQFILRTKGQEELDRIHLKAGQMSKPTADDYLFLANAYKERVAWQMEHFPGKFPKAA